MVHLLPSLQVKRKDSFTSSGGWENEGGKRMSNFLEELPNDYGHGSLQPTRALAKRAGRTAMRYASLTGLTISAITFAMAVI